VLVEAVRRLGYVRHSHVEADALWLVTMTRVHYGLGTRATNEAQRRALAGVASLSCWRLAEVLRDALHVGRAIPR
jgi:hypothetical protein